MPMLSGKKLRAYLAFEVHGKKDPSIFRKPPQIARNVTPIPKKRPGNPRKGPPRDPKYISWVRTLPCISCGIHGRSEAAHTGSDGGMRMKASDYSCLPLCPSCHRTGPQAYHGKNGGRMALEQRIGKTAAHACRELMDKWHAR